MEHLWKRIRTWFEANVPPENFRMNRGATEGMLANVEEIVRARLPEDVRESYLIHNGMHNGALYLNQHLLSCEGIINMWQMYRQNRSQMEYLRPHPEGPVRAVPWDLKWILITDSGGGGQTLIDLNPAAGGTIGQVVDYHFEDGPIRVLAPSFRAWLTQFADDLEAGRYQFDEFGGNIERVEN